MIGDNNIERGNVSFDIKKGKKVEKEFNYEEIIEKISDILEIGKLDKKINLTGGIVPWIVLNENSGRPHSDIDFFVNSKEMPYVRKILKKRNLYDSNSDTFLEDSNIDYGLDTTIADIPVSFFPYEVLEYGRGVIQRSFYIDTKTGERGYREMQFRGIKEQDYISHTSLPNGKKIGIISLEVLKLLKEKSNRPKDTSDIAAIDKAGIDARRYFMLKNSISIENPRAEFCNKIKCNVAANNTIREQYEEIKVVETTEQSVEVKE